MTEPMHCGRPMWEVKNRATNELPYNAPIWWCPECHHHLPRVETNARRLAPSEEAAALERFRPMEGE